MLGNWTKPQIATIFSLAFVEALWRTTVELVGLADVVLLPVGALLLSKEVLDAAAVGQLLAFLLYWTATFQILPEVFPERYLGWGNDALVRGIIALGVVIAASLFDVLIGQLAFLDGGSFTPVATIIALVGVSIGAGLLTTEQRVQVLPQIQPFPRYIRYRQFPSNDALKRLEVGVVISRVLLILAFGGLAIAVVGRLYPLPEVFFIFVTAFEGLSGPKTVRSDIAEGFLVGLRAIWVGPRGILGISYGIGGLLAVVLVVTWHLTNILNWAEMIADPVTLLFLLSTLGIGTVYAATSLVRLVERLPADIVDSTVALEQKPLIPGLLLPAGALFAWYVGVRPVPGPFEPYPLNATVPELGIALILATGAIIPLLRPSLGPKLPISDYVTIALAPSLGLAAFVILTPIFSSGASLDNPLIGFYAAVLFPLSPFLGLELYRLDRYERFGKWFNAVMLKTPVSRVGSPGERIFDLISEICLAAIVMTIGFSLIIVFEPGSTIFISTFIFPAIASIIFRSILVPFYIPEMLFG